MHAVASPAHHPYAEKGIKLVKGDIVTALEGADGKVGQW